MQIHELTALARQMKASDIHISEGLPLMFRIDGRLVNAPVQMSADETRSLILGLMDEAHLEAVTTERIDADFALVAPDGTRSRVNVFYQQNKAAATLRLLSNSIPTLAELSMPPVLTKLADEPRGLILVTGPTGSGKSTTLAAMIDHINETRSDHIITIENPIEYVYQGKQALIHQREVGQDVSSFAAALRSALREDPDVILVGEMRDYETISAAVTAADDEYSFRIRVQHERHVGDHLVICPFIFDGCLENAVKDEQTAVFKGISNLNLLIRCLFFMEHFCDFQCEAKVFIGPFGDVLFLFHRLSPSFPPSLRFQQPRRIRWRLFLLFLLLYQQQPLLPLLRKVQLLLFQRFLLFLQRLRQFLLSGQECLQPVLLLQELPELLVLPASSAQSGSAAEPVQLWQIRSGRVRI